MLKKLPILNSILPILREGLNVSKTLSLMYKDEHKPSEVAAAGLNKNIELPDRLLEIRSENPLNIMHWFGRITVTFIQINLLSILALIAIASIFGMFWSPNEGIHANIEPHKKVIPVILVILFSIPLSVTFSFSWALMILGFPTFFRMHRFCLRARSLIFGSLPSVSAHLLVYVVTEVAILGFAVLSLWLLYLTVKSYPDYVLLHFFMASMILNFLGILTILFFYFLAEAFRFVLRYAPIRKLQISMLNDSENLNSSNGQGYQNNQNLFTHELTFAHFSDLHLTGSVTEVRIETGTPGGNSALDQLIDINLISLKEEVNCIIVTGDITDTGSDREWNEFFRILEQDLHAKSIIVPGNHDVNIPRRVTATLDDDSWDILALRFILAANKIQGHRASILDEEDNLIKLTDYLSGAANNITEYVRLRNGRDKSDDDESIWKMVSPIVSNIWGSIFPMAVTIPNSNAIVFVLNSNDRSSNALTNAFGYLGTVQLNRLRKLKNIFKNRPQIIATHHHVSNNLVEQSDKNWISRIQQRGMSIHDARLFFSELQKDPALVFNGHRHVEYMAKIGEHSTVLSAPSTTLGNELAKDQRIGFRKFRIGWGGNLAPEIISHKFLSI